MYADYQFYQGDCRQQLARLFAGLALVLHGANAAASENVPPPPPATIALPSGSDVSNGLGLDRGQRWRDKGLDVRNQQSSMQHPVAPFAYRRISSDFGLRKDPFFGSWRNHQGIDLPGVTGTPIYASNDGWVDHSGYASGYGLLVRIDHGQGIETLYGHLSGVATQAHRHVYRGALIGYLGSTGRSAGPHLHFEVRQFGRAIDPLAYLATGSYRPIALPPSFAPQPAHISNHARQRSAETVPSKGLPGSL